MKYNWIIDEIERIENRIISHRRILHEIAEVGSSLEKTLDYVKGELLKIGCEPIVVGKCGISCLIDGTAKGDPFDEENVTTSFLSFTTSTNIDEKNITKVTQKIKKFPKNFKTVILRADMDALPIPEKTNLSFKSTNGNMHACGHDMHTAMLLGCAEALTKNKDKFSGKIKLVFQGGEEILEGALDMIENGVLCSPSVDFGVMVHVLTSTNLDTGTAIFANSGVSAPSSDFFKITIKGASAHGGMPTNGIDPSIPCAHIILALESLINREAANPGDGLITIGEIHSGAAPNVISECATIKGTLRSFDEKTRKILKKRLCEIVDMYSSAHKASGKVEFTSGCPVLKNDEVLIEKGMQALNEVYSYIGTKTRPSVLSADSFPSRSYASEDFSYFSQKIPTVMVGICAGKRDEGYIHPLHHPQAKFDEKALLYGAITYCTLGMKFLS